MALWSERDKSLGVLMSSSIRNLLLSRNNVKLSYAGRYYLLSSSTPVDNNLFFVTSDNEDSYKASQAASTDFSFHNPNDYFFVLKRPHKIIANMGTYPYSADNFMISASNNVNLNENNKDVELWSSPLFYHRDGPSQYNRHGALAFRKDSHEMVSGLLKPLAQFLSSSVSSSGSTQTAVTTLQCPYTRIWGIGRIARGGSLELSTPPINFNSSIYYSNFPIPGNSVFNEVGTFGEVLYSGVTKSPFYDSGFDNSIATITDLDPYLLASLYPNVLFVDTYEELEALRDMTNDELELIALNYDPDSPYTPGIGGGTISGTGGGGGNFGVVNGTPETSDPITPSLPPSGSFEGSVANSGLFVHYAVNAPILKKVGDWLWTSDLGLVIAKEFMSILYGSPIESAISLMSYPFNVTALNGIVTNTQRIVWGSQQLTDTLGDIQAPAITSPYATIDWGTVQLTEFWGNFLDYAPHTKLELYLPWCTGFVPIDPNECLPGSLRVVTNIELAKGTCLHNVIGNDGRVIATHSGTCGKQLPLTALDTSGKALSLVSTAVSMAVAGGAGAAAQMAGDAAYGNFMAGAVQLGMTPSHAVGAGHTVRQEAMAPHHRTQNRARNMALAGSAAATRTPSHVQRNGSFSGSSAGLGVQYPYLILSRPTQSVPAQYGHHYGYPSNIYTPLTNLRGYTEVGEIHLTGFVCTEDELTEIDSLLKGGVIL